MSTQPDEGHVLSEMMKDASESFDKLCQERHDAGAKEYGVFTFMANDVVRMMAEELADTANYCRMQFIKLMILQKVLEADLDARETADDDGNFTIGVRAFRGAGETGWS